MEQELTDRAASSAAAGDTAAMTFRQTVGALKKRFAVTATTAGKRRARRERRRHSRPTRGRHRVPGCFLLCAGAVAIVLVASVLAFLTVERVTERLVRNALPTPTRTPDIAALGPGLVLGPPSLGPDEIRAVLAAYGSPAAGEAQAFYDFGVERGIDPAYCVAFFIIESSAGTRGVARTTFSVGNIRARPGEPSYEGYRLYDSWRAGIADWYRLIDELYVGEWGLTTIDEIVPVYAPSHDNNDTAAYIRSVKLLVAGWRGL